MKKNYLFALLLCALIVSRAQTPTWANNTACIFYTHCTTCHHANGIAPFSLLDYSTAYAQRYNILNDINGHIMPPFPPDITYQQYQGERYLSEAELGILNAWVNGGAPMGDSTQAPVAPVYTSGSVITSPDFTSRIPDYTVPPLSSDLYRCFVISNPFSQEEYIAGMEVIPGNPTAVHHVLVFQDTSQIPVQLDNADPNPGYTNFGGDGSNSAKMIGAWVPGSNPYFLPSAMGIKIPAGARIIIQIHYPAGSSGKLDSTRVNIKYNTSPGLRTVSIQPILNHVYSLTDGPLVIPANTIDTFHESFTLPGEVSVLSIAPHAHLVCDMMQAFAVLPTGDTLPLVKIDKWNFHWQGSYNFKKLMVLPTGTVLHGIAIYNNTSSNLLNPNSPPQQVTVGESTTNEMMLFYFSYTLYQAGDENTVYDTTTYIPSYLDCNYEAMPTAVDEPVQLHTFVYPNPTSGLLEITLDGPKECFAQLTDLSGKQLRSMYLNAGYNTTDLSGLAPGIYFVKLTDTGGLYRQQTVRVIKQ